MTGQGQQPLPALSRRRALMAMAAFLLVLVAFRAVTAKPLVPHHHVDVLRQPYSGPDEPLLRAARADGLAPVAEEQLRALLRLRVPDEVRCVADVGQAPSEGLALLLARYPNAQGFGFYSSGGPLPAALQGRVTASFGDPVAALRAWRGPAVCQILHLGAPVPGLDLLDAARVADGGGGHVVVADHCEGARRTAWDAGAALGELQSWGTRAPATGEAGARPWCVGSFDVRVTSERFTAVFAGHSPERVPNHERLLRHFSSLPFLIERVVFVWNGAQPYRRTEAELNAGAAVPVTLVSGEGNSLNNRWKPRPGVISTPAVFVFDDDVLMPADDLRCMFRAWQRNRQRLVGVYTRTAELPYETHDAPDAYAIVLPRAVFLAREHLTTYSEVMPESLRRLVDEQAAHCDDIALNAAVSHETGLPPLRVAVPSEAVELHEGKGLGTSKNRKQERAECVMQIAETYPPGTFMTTGDVFTCPGSS